MKTNLLRKTIAVSLTALLLATVLSLILGQVQGKGVAYAAAEEIYYGDDGYAGSGESTLQTETIAYVTKKVTTNLLNNTFPAYYNMNVALSNECANVAGANIIGYYDRYYDNLIPDCVVGVARGTNYTYYPMETNAAKKQAVIDDLYIRMNTNGVSAGTSQTQYKNGLTSYVNSKGRSIAYSSVMANGRLDIAKLNQAINDGTPVSLYLSGYNVTEIKDGGGTVTLSKHIYTADHIMIVYGYQTVEYYNGNNALVKAKTYLFVASGIKGIVGNYVLDNNGTVNDAEGVKIN